MKKIFINEEQMNALLQRTYTEKLIEGEVQVTANLIMEEDITEKMGDFIMNYLKPTVADSAVASRVTNVMYDNPATEETGDGVTVPISKMSVGLSGIVSLLNEYIKQYPGAFQTLLNKLEPAEKEAIKTIILRADDADEDRERQDESNYPAGAEHDSNAPWNDVERNIEKVDSSGEYELIAWDGHEMAMLKKGDLNFFLWYDEIDEDLIPTARDFTGEKDEDGYPEYDTEVLEPDDDTILAFAETLTPSNGGIDAIELGDGNSLTLIDDEFKSWLMIELSGYIKRGYRGKEAYTFMLDYLKKI